MARWEFTKGLHDIGRGCFAYLQPPGGTSQTNAGLIVDGEASLLVDTLYDLAHTRAMLAAMRDAAPAAVRIGTVVNTHADGDHTWGNQLVAGADIVGHVTLAEEFANVTPAVIMDVLKHRDQYGPGAQMLYEEIGLEFRFDDIVLTPPTRTFEHELGLKVGDKAVRLLHVGPAHSRADTLVWVPADRVVYTGDILFVKVHPTIWSGPVSKWLKACDLMLSWDVDVVVPGHGPLTDKDGIRRLQHYLRYIHDEARKRFDAGLGYYEAACDIALDPYADWIAAERIVFNVAYLYREFGATNAPDAFQTQNDVARYRAQRLSATRRAVLPPGE